MRGAGGNGARDGREAGGSRGAHDLVDIPLGDQARGEGVLSRAATDNKNSHQKNDLGCASRLHGGGNNREYFVDVDGVCA